MFADQGAPGIDHASIPLYLSFHQSRLYALVGAKSYNNGSSLLCGSFRKVVIYVVLPLDNIFVRSCLHASCKNAMNVDRASSGTIFAAYCSQNQT